MKLAFSSNAYLHVSIGDTIAKIASLGDTSIEILADGPHAGPAGVLPERVDSMRNSLDAHGLTISNINAFMRNAVADPRQPYWHPGWTDPDPHDRASRREHTKPSRGPHRHHQPPQPLPQDHPVCARSYSTWWRSKRRSGDERPMARLGGRRSLTRTHVRRLRAAHRPSS